MYGEEPILFASKSCLKLRVEAEKMFLTVELAKVRSIIRQKLSQT